MLAVSHLASGVPTPNSNAAPEDARVSQAMRGIHGAFHCASVTAEIATPRPLCKDARPMRSLRPAIVALVCSCLLLLQALGVHAHAIPATQVHEQLALDAHEHYAVVSGLDSHHATAHVKDGAADVEPAKVSGKGAPTLILLALLGAAFLFSFLSAPRSIAMPALSPVPIRRRGGYLLPPSQAPPLAS